LYSGSRTERFSIPEIVVYRRFAEYGSMKASLPGMQGLAAANQ
jgi:hypothetical protein